ncbi:L-lactate dehydrogenase [Clostridium sp. 19966]|uniref:L-lactate dehydrogenase n=1 Tax=Clostridium sp. 19966 TaxID=2768166 RepID=UPI0028DEAEB9|nr:L-lactate dehydrogenase [Clostridium sp. 19966]MDT8716185.1 L-lactate dehydrogenase [Clostridium sp. 19966]
MKPVKNKVVVIGAGMVGSSVLNALLSLSLISEIVIVDMNKDKAKGEALDASHTTSFAYSPNVSIRVGDYEDCKDAQVIVMTAGPSIKPGEKLDRLILADRNVKVMSSVMESICKYTKDAVIITVSNPVDILTYLAQNHFGYDEKKIIGTGTSLDTARFRRIIAEKYSVDAKNVHGYIMGEHGSSAFATWSTVNIAGVPFDKLSEVYGKDVALNKEEILNEVREVGLDIVQYKGYTSSGIAMTVNRLVKAVLLNEQSILPVSTTLRGEYGIKNVALSIPCILSSEGIDRKVEVPLASEEIALLKKSAENMSEVLKSLNI